MPIADYAHHNEEAERIWWEEEGTHEPMQSEEYGREDFYNAADAFAEELGETETPELRELLTDQEYLARWPRAKEMIEWELKNRGAA